MIEPLICEALRMWCDDPSMVEAEHSRVPAFVTMVLDALEAAEANLVLMQDGPTTEEWMAMLHDSKAENERLRATLKEMMTAASDFAGDYSFGPPDSLRDAFKKADAVLDDNGGVKE